MCDEKKIPALCEHKPSLDGSSSFEAQFSALASCGKKQDDLTFRESSVKDVTDRGREEGATRLMAALEKSLIAHPPKPSPRAIAPPVSKTEQAEEAEVRREVHGLLKTLQGLRQDGPTATRNATAMHVLRQLSDLNVSVACLKATKIAAELNTPCWRGSEVSVEVRKYASALVKEWRMMYRAETGSVEDTISPAARSRKCKNLSMDLEESAYARHQRVAHYTETIDCLCAIIRGDAEAARGFLGGTLGSKELAARASREVRLRRARTLAGIKN